MTGVKITDSFWVNYRNIVRNQMLPYQWKVLNDKIDIVIEKERDDDFIPNEKSHAIENFKIAAGRTKGRHYGWVFQDSDVYKWLEAAAYTLQEKPDPELKENAEWVIDLIGDAQEADGYLGTYFTIEEPDRKFKRLSESHELYCAGHYMEAAVAYYQAVKNEKALHIACRLADCIDRNFGMEEGKIKGCDGHEEIEIGLLKLYQATGEKRYLKLCLFFLEQRGADKDFFIRQKQTDTADTPLIAGMERFPQSYFQMHRPLIEQDTADGHAVRLVYLCIAMAEAAKETDDETLWQVCKKIWRNVVDKRMYITGGIGSTVYGEAFTFDYDLPNDVMYCETCAAVGMFFWAYHMLEKETSGEYADIMERVLYNAVLSGMALDGKHFFYVNPLEVFPEASKKVPGKSHVKPVRPQWLGCACCPPNLARLLASLDKYVFVQNGNQIRSILYLDCKGIFNMPEGVLRIVQKTEYPWKGRTEYLLDYSGEKEIEFGIRIPEREENYEILLNGKKISGEYKNGFVFIKRNFKNDMITVEIPMDTIVWQANPMVRSDVGMLSVSRGPFIYCLEEIDNGKNLHLVSIKKDTDFLFQLEQDLLGGIGTLKCKGQKICIESSGGKLYHKAEEKEEAEEIELKWIPYYAWANRGENEMCVWVHGRK